MKFKVKILVLLLLKMKALSQNQIFGNTTRSQLSTGYPFRQL